MTFVDRVLTCMQCGTEFVFTSGEQEFFADKGFERDPKRCKQCRIHRNERPYRLRQETKTTCAECAKETTVPFKPTRGKPVLCHSCFKKSQDRSPGPRLVIKNRESTRANL